MHRLKKNEYVSPNKCKKKVYILQLSFWIYVRKNMNLSVIIYLFLERHKYQNSYGALISCSLFFLKVCLYQPVYDMEKPSARTSSPHPCRPTHPAPISCNLAPWIQAGLCGISMAPYIAIEHKWAGNQLKHSPCLFASLAGNIHPRLSSQRPQFSSTLHGPPQVLINFWVLQVELFKYVIVAF